MFAYFAYTSFNLYGIDEGRDKAKNKTSLALRSCREKMPHHTFSTEMNIYMVKTVDLYVSLEVIFHLRYIEKIILFECCVLSK